MGLHFLSVHLCPIPPPPLSLFTAQASSVRVTRHQGQALPHIQTRRSGGESKRAGRDPSPKVAQGLKGWPLLPGLPPGSASGPWGREWEGWARDT